MVHPPSDTSEHAARVKAALEKGGWDAPPLWRKSRPRKPRKAQLEFRDRDLPSLKEAEVDTPERAPP